MALRQFVLALIAAVSLTAFAGWAQTLAEPTLAAKPIPDWYVRGIAAALLDPTPGMPRPILDLPQVFS